MFVEKTVVMNWQEYIGSDEKILSGKPAVKGTRLSVDFLLERLADGWTEQELLDNYPRLTKEALKALFTYVHVTMKDNLIYFPTIDLRQAS
jgi:uncharacterized protein (DUF433 family)